MGNSCSTTAPPLHVKNRYTLVYNPLSSDCIDTLAHWVLLASKYNRYANFSAIIVIDKTNERSLGILPSTDPRKLPVVFVHNASGNTPVAVPYDQIGIVENELNNLVFLDSSLQPLGV